MDRDQLLAYLNDLDAVAVTDEGTINDCDNNGYSPEDVEAELASMEEDCERLRKIVAWAKLAPRYQPAKVTA